MKIIVLLLLVVFKCTYIKAQCWRSISAGDHHNLTIRTDGTLWAWGGNLYGELGDGTNILKNKPAKLGLEANWEIIAGSKFGNSGFSLGIKSDGTLWGWGDNRYGQLGNNSFLNHLVPKQIGSASDWRFVAAGSLHSVALKNDGTLWCWGNNLYGQLGDGTLLNKYVPTQIGTLHDWKTVSAGHIQTIGLKNNGTLWKWGFFQNGIDSINNIPIQIGTDTNWRDISVSASHVLALKDDGTIWAWGTNHFGGLGNSNPNTTNIPVQVQLPSAGQSISAGASYSHAVLTDGALWAWGINFDGQLGNGDNVNSFTPIRIGADTNWGAVSSGYNHVIAIKKDSTLWSWGNNEYGQLGDGTYISKNSPNQVQCFTTVPLNLIFFYAEQQKNTISLIWKTSYEQNVKNIEIQRSFDGVIFNQISSVHPGNYPNCCNYSFIDEHPNLGKNYYRLKTIDIDNDFSYSQIVQRDFALTENHAIIFPNPVNEFLIIKNSFKNSKITISIFNSTGQLIKQIQKSNSTQLQIPVQNLTTGIYSIMISDETQSIIKTIIKK